AADPSNPVQNNCGQGDISKYLKQGNRRVTIEYYNNLNSNGAELHFLWDNSGSMAAIPADKFMPDLNRVTSITDPVGPTNYGYPTSAAKVSNLPATKARGARSTSYTYDAWGRVLTETDALSHVTTYTYGTDGNSPCITQLVDPSLATSNFT